MVLKNKTIVIISPQSWGRMFVSKHHYAIELARYGNTVYFLNPPLQDKNEKPGINIEESIIYPRLFIISHRLRFPYNLKFHLMPLFHFLMKRHIKKILLAMKRKPDIIWSFDLGNLYPFRFFPKKAIKIFHPVDEPLNNTAFNSAKGAQYIFSVTNEILEKFHSINVPKHFINHGVSELFLHSVKTSKIFNAPLRVGFSGNLMRQDIDREIFLQIIQENPELIFECWGTFEPLKENIGGNEDKETSYFIQILKRLRNVHLHGAIESIDLAKEYQRMDAFLICYDVCKDQSSGTNYHKILEFLSSGKVIISNNITTYQDLPALVQMVTERTTNKKLPALFKKVMGNINYYNSDTNCNIRREYSLNNTYSKQIEKIEDFLFKLV